MEDLCAAFKKLSFISANQQTAEWRKLASWYKNGKSNECELYQKRQLEEMGLKIAKTNLRLCNGSLVECKQPMKFSNGYEYSENFDGCFNDKVLFNLKMVCGCGGAQTRTLREVYHFIKQQVEFLNNTRDNYKFINILDGNESYNNMDKFDYILEKNRLKCSTRIFVGDMVKFHTWWFRNTI